MIDKKFPLHIKYRPKIWDDIVGNKTTINSLKVIVKEGKVKTFLLSGASGCGKTTIARIIKNEVGCSDFDFQEINAANNRGIDTIRDIIQECRFHPFSGESKVFLLDECFCGSVHVLIDYDKSIPIKEIIDNQFITEVLSYDLEKKQILKKKILRKIKVKKHDEDAITITVEYMGKKYNLSSTIFHKFFVLDKGEIEARNLSVGDNLIGFIGNNFNRQYICSKCGNKFENFRQFKIHNINCKSRNPHFGKEYRKKLSEERKGKRNPMFGKKGSSKYWDNLSDEQRLIQIKRFMEAPKYNNSPNNPEKIVMDMQIGNEKKKLEFTGDGKFFLKLKNEDGSYRVKNPDFVVRIYKEDGEIEKIIKYVEVMDLEFWHKNDAEKIQKCYERSGKEVLILNAKEISENPNMIKAKLESFVNNDFPTIVDIRKHKVPPQSKGWLYNLEIENTHNYFVCANEDSRSIIPQKVKVICKNQHIRNPFISETIRYKKFGNKGTGLLPILVSNCHQITGTGAEALLKIIEDTPPNVYFILATTNPEKLIPTIRNRCSHYQVFLLNPFEIKALLQKIIDAEKIVGITEKVIREIARISEGCPRQALIILEQIKNLETERSMLDSILVFSIGEESIINFCRGLLYKEWKFVLNILPELNDDPEQIRRAILTYMSKVILSDVDQSKRAAKILANFAEPFFSTGKPGLILAAWKCYI